jgi:ribose transport system permease protein
MTAVAEPPVMVADEPESPIRRRSVVRRVLRPEYGVLYAWALIIAWFAWTLPDTFLSTTTMRIIMSDSAVTGVLALGVLIAFSTGAIDLSFGAMAGFSMVLMAKLGATWQQNDFVLAGFTMAACVALGCVTALLIVRFNVPSMIASLGMASVLLGLAQWLSGGNTISGGLSQSFQDFGRGTVFGLPHSFVYLLILAMIVWYILEMLPTGRRMFATGANPEAARLSGVRTPTIQFGGMVGCAAIAGFAGILLAAKVGLATDSVGPPFLLPAVAAVFLGSTQIKPRVNVLGTLIAVYALATGIKGLQLAGAASWVDDFFNGVALLVAVTFAFGSQVSNKNRLLRPGHSRTTKGS